MYGHMDKQPPFEGWEPDLGPFNPVIKNGRLYGRGGADDGYAIISSILAIKAIQNQHAAHSRCGVLIQASEESGSPVTTTLRGILVA
jgi:acetylornithine deacetylase/succinyl-diaminopimelate desuccinylase-like protein